MTAVYIALGYGVFGTRTLHGIELFNISFRELEPQ